MVPRINERSYISLFRGSGCSSSVGRQGGKQKLKLGPNCVSSVGVVIHELMHAVGKKINFNICTNELYFSILILCKIGSFEKFQVSGTNNLDKTGTNIL